MNWLGAFKPEKGGEDQDHEYLLATGEETYAEKEGRDHGIEQEALRNWVDGLLAIALLLTFFLFACSLVIYWRTEHILSIETRCTKKMSGYCQSILGRSHSETDILNQPQCSTQ